MSATPSQNVAGILLPPSHSANRNPRKTNPRREKFALHYIETWNATKAAIAAGYSEKSAAATGSRLLTNAEVKSAIEYALLRQAELSDISATFVLDGIRSIAENIDARHADRLRAYELLGKHLKLFTDRAEADTQITVTIERIGG